MHVLGWPFQGSMRQLSKVSPVLETYLLKGNCSLEHIASRQSKPRARDKI